MKQGAVAVAIIAVLAGGWVLTRKLPAPEPTAAGDKRGVGEAANVAPAPKRDAPKIKRVDAPKAAAPKEEAVALKLPVVEQLPTDKLPQQPAAAPGAKFTPSQPAEDFTEPIDKAHAPAAMRKVAQKFAAWAKANDKAGAEVEFLGVDCRKPPCMMALEFNADRGNDFYGRAEKWLQANGGAGKVYLYPHNLDADNQRMYAYFSPHKPGTAAHHQFTKPALDRIHEQVKALPQWNLSKEITESE